jgi:hypothetical protein
MTGVSHPLRALGVVLGGWTAARVVALWPTAMSVGMPAIDVASADPAPASNVSVPLSDKVPLFAERPLTSHRLRALAKVRLSAAQATQTATIDSPVAAPRTVTPEAPTTAMRSEQPKISSPVAPGLPIAAETPQRWSGSAWALMRGDSAASLASGGQLGGSQIGMRLFYAPGPEALAITARVSAPLNQPAGREAAIGVALKGRNVGLIAEQRFSLEKGGRDAPAVFAYGGVSDVKLGHDFKLDGYAQAGVVGIKQPAAFIDGAIRVERPVLTTDKASLSIGAGAWGGAQPGAARLDIGPQVVARMAVGETNLRVSAEWRQRIAGDAAPASGPAVTVGFDF